MAIKRIFLDLDGVLADWTSAAIRVLGHEPEQVYAAWPPGVCDVQDALGISGNALWAAVNGAGHKMWSDLEPFEWCGDLFALCESKAPTTILTASSRDPKSASGKLAWMQSVFGTKFRNYLIGPDKPACAYPGAVLIDDRDDGCKAFIAAGGAAIVFPQIWNSNREHAKDRDVERGRDLELGTPWLGRLEFVRDRLRELEE